MRKLVIALAVASLIAAQLTDCDSPLFLAFTWTGLFLGALSFFIISKKGTR